MKKIFKISKLRLLAIPFAILFIVSFFMCINALADTNTFTISNAEIIQRSTTASGDIENVTSKEVENNVVFHTLGDYVIYNINIKNNLSKEVTIISISDDNANSYIAYEYDSHANEVITPNNSFDFKVKATYQTELTDVSNRSQSNTVRFTIKYEVDGSIEEDTIDINPKTHDGIGLNIIILIMSASGLIVCIVFDKKINKTLKVIAILVLSLVPTIISAETYTYDIAIVTDVGIYDKQVVTLVVDGVEETKTVPYNELVTVPDVPIIPGYNFVGWQDENGNPFDISTPITSDLKISTVYEAIEYDITYTLKGGTATNPVKYTIEDTVTLNDATKEGYNFVGWTGTDLTEPTKNVSFSGKTGARSYTANFTVINYEIHYHGLTEVEEQTLGNPDYYTIEQNVTIANPLDRVDSDGDVYERFTGWTYGDSTSTNISIPQGSTGPRDFTANFVHVDPDTYTITYDLDGGAVSEANPDSYTIKSDAITLHNPAKEGYTFIGWTGTDLSGLTTTVTIPARSTGNRSYTANYSLDTYTISYTNLTPAEVSSFSLPEDYTYETNTFTLGTLSRDGYTFDGWTGSNGSTPGDVTINKGTTGNKTYTANFSLVDYDIDYTLNGGSITGTNPITYNVETGVIVLINPTKEGYTFKGWSGTDLTGNENTSVTIPSGATGDREYTANFTANKYDVIFEKNGTGVTGTMADQELTYDVQDNLTANAYERAGYIFNGWNTDPDGLGTSYSDSAEVLNLVTSGSITLYAQWVDDMVTLSFDENGGNSVTDISVRRGESTSLPTPTNNDTNLAFLGWYEDINDINPVSDPYTLTSDIELIAKWTPIICRKATSLNSTTCNSPTGQGCLFAGYTAGDTITFGNIVRNDGLSVGDAIDCMVNDTDGYLRFYYLRTVDNKAVLISNSNFEGSNGQANDNNYKYDVALTKLPTTTQWDKLPISYGEYAARFVRWDDLTEAAGTEDITTKKSLKDLPFLFENIGKYSTNAGRSTVWLEARDEDGTLKGYRYHSNGIYVTDGVLTGNSASSNCVRPVIEVPIQAIADDYVIKYDAGAGTTPNEYALVKKGSAIGELPNANKTGYVLENWYDTPLFERAIDEDYIPTGYETYYAKYVKSIDSATLEYDEFDLTIDETDTILFVDESDLEPRTFASNDDTIVSVDENGNIIANALGTTQIVITGSVSGTTKIVTVKVQEIVPNCTIEFDEDGGSEVTDMIIPRNATISSVGSLPTSNKTNYIFGGWFTDNTFAREITNDSIIKTDLVLIAKWIPSDAVAEVNNKDFYTTLADAVTNASANATIKILKDFTLSSSIDLRKDLSIDLNNKTITSSGRAFQVYSKVEIGNGTIKTSGSSGIIDVVASNNVPGELTMNSGTLIATGDKQGIYINGGIAYLGGTVNVTSRAKGETSNRRSTVHVLGGGKAVITGGTYTNNRTTNEGYAISVVDSGSILEIGSKDGAYDVNNIVIQGSTYGIYSDNDYSLYDGIIKGKTNAVNDELKILLIEDGSIKVNDNEDTYKVLYYQMPAGKIRITLDTDGGNLPPGANDYVLINLGSQVGTLPEPTKGIYTFDGWFDDNNQEVLSTRVPIQDETYHAVWSYTPSDTPVSFNMTNDVMMNYFNNINTWKTQYTVTGTKADVSAYTEVLDSTQFEASMRANFDAYNCSYCGTDPNNNKCDNPSAGNRCELPNGYNTGLSENINVYEYNTSTWGKTLVTYTTSDNGIIYNMIPGKTYLWESTSDSNIYGYVAPTAVRRTIYSSARNVRDLGGMSVSFTRDNATKTGTLKYGKLYRGAQLSKGQTDVDSLTKLGITREVDLRIQTEGNNPVRLPKHDKCDGNCGTLPSSQDIIMTNYLIYPSNSANYSSLRDTLKYVMTSVVNGDNIYFHCTIGTDRTGTLAYFLEGLLGVSEEERLEDYELSYFYGMLNRTRFHDNLSSSSINPRFTSMYKTYDTNDKIYDWYMYGLTDEQKASEKVLIEQFRDAMIDYN